MELIARIFAETGVNLALKMFELVYQQKRKIVRIRGKQASETHEWEHRINVAVCRTGSGSAIGTTNAILQKTMELYSYNKMYMDQWLI